MAAKLPQESEQAIEISKKADIKIKDEPHIEQAYLYATKSLAHQYLNDWKSAEKSMKQSMKFLNGLEYKKEEKLQAKEISSEFWKTKIYSSNRT